MVIVVVVRVDGGGGGGGGFREAAFYSFYSKQNILPIPQFLNYIVSPTQADDTHNVIEYRSL